MAIGYIAAVPRGRPAIRFEYEPVSEDECKALREQWAALNHSDQTTRSVQFLASRLKSLAVLTNRPPTPKGEARPWEDVPLTETRLRTLPEGGFARVLWIVMGLHESDADPGQPPATAPNSATTATTDPTSPPIAPAEQEKPATGPESGSSTPDQVAATSATPEQTQ